MDEKERYRAKIEARMMRFNETIEEITGKAKQRKATQPDIKIENFLQKHQEAKAKLKELEQSDDKSWQRFKAELDQLLDGVDQDLRKAMAYFG
jgi:hypothetical protein